MNSIFFCVDIVIAIFNELNDELIRVFFLPFFCIILLIIEMTIVTLFCSWGTWRHSHYFIMRIHNKIIVKFSRRDFLASFDLSLLELEYHFVVRRALLGVTTLFVKFWSLLDSRSLAVWLWATLFYDISDLSIRRCSNGLETLHFAGFYLGTENCNRFYRICTEILIYIYGLLTIY